ncbi:MAG TPA: DEAD/DEAH box helicase family protein, partial [Nonomuraea sp.]|nr:DEAD/DEAH box helicase family protein [Nonomuraea sp.]
MSTKPHSKWESALALARGSVVLRARDLEAHGIPRAYLGRLCEAGILEQTGRGLYRSKAFDGAPHLMLAQAAKRVPQGVVSLTSALHFHGLWREALSEVWMTIGTRARAPVDGSPPIRIVRAAGAPLTEGVERHEIAGVATPIYGLAKSVVDCFRYRQHVRRDHADQVLRDAVGQGLVTIDELWRWAEISRVRSAIRPHVELLSRPVPPPPRLRPLDILASNEADTCRRLVAPRLQRAGWDEAPHVMNEQRSFTDGRVVLTGERARRGRQKRADFLLRYRADFPIAVVEAKARYRDAADGVQQAKDYAEILGLRFAYATNGEEIIEVDYTRGTEEPVADFPAPDELWARLRAAEGLNDIREAEKLLTPAFPDPTRPLRYYQEVAINRTVQEIVQGRDRLLLVLCTGSGKTQVAFQTCWKLWSSRWNRDGEHRTPKILFLADRNVL